MTYKIASEVWYYGSNKIFSKVVFLFAFQKLVNCERKPLNVRCLTWGHGVLNFLV